MVVRWSASEIGLAVAPRAGRLASKRAFEDGGDGGVVDRSAGFEDRQGIEGVIGHWDGGAPQGKGSKAVVCSRM